NRRTGNEDQRRDAKKRVLGGSIESHVSYLPMRRSDSRASNAAPGCQGPAARTWQSGRRPLSRLRVWVELSESGFSSVGHLDPLGVGRGLGVVVVMPVPPFVRRRLGVTLWRVLPSLLAAERRDVEVAPNGPHRFVAAVVDEVCAEHPLAIAEKHVVAVPFIDAEVLVEAVGDL